MRSEIYVQTKKRPDRLLNSNRISVCKCLLGMFAYIYFYLDFTHTRSTTYRAMASLLPAIEYTISFSRCNIIFKLNYRSGQNIVPPTLFCLEDLSSHACIEANL